MKPAHKINKEGGKEDKLKSTQTHTHTNRPIKNKKINSHKTKTSKGEKMQNKYIIK